MSVQPSTNSPYRRLKSSQNLALNYEFRENRNFMPVYSNCSTL